MVVVNLDDFSVFEVVKVSVVVYGKRVVFVRVRSESKNTELVLHNATRSSVFVFFGIKSADVFFTTESVNDNPVERIFVPNGSVVIFVSYSANHFFDETEVERRFGIRFVFLNVFANNRIHRILRIHWLVGSIVGGVNDSGDRVGSSLLSEIFFSISVNNAIHNSDFSQVSLFVSLLNEYDRDNGQGYYSDNNGDKPVSSAIGI